MDSINLEKLQQLTGERGDVKKAAVRRGDVTLGAMKSKQITAAPTAADYNALQSDVAALWSALGALARKP